MKYFVIILILIVFSGSFLFGNYAYGMWFPLSPEDLIEQSKTIFVGTITAVNPVDVEYQSRIARDGTKKDSVGPEVMTLEEYTVDVEEFLKNPQDSDTMKVLRATVSGVPSGPSKISGFEVGDRVLFYLPKDEKQTHFPGQYLPESFKIPKQCDAKSILEQPRIEGGNQFSIMQNDIQREDNFTANIPIQYSYDRDGGTLSGQSFNVSVGINKVTDNSIKNVFQKRIQVNYEPCKWIGTAKWDFVPQPGKYSMTVHVSEGSGGSGFSRSFSVLEAAETSSTPNKEIKTSLKLDDLASELWYDHDYIIDGTILDIRGYDKSERTYDIQINSFFKPTEGAGPKVITVYGSPNFYNVKDDRGIFFIKKDDARWIFGEYGAKITGECLPELMYHNPPLIDPPLVRGPPPTDYSLLVDCYPHYYKKYLPQYMKARGATEFPSPLTQQRDRVSPNEVVCNEGLELVMKNNGRASCVKPSTIEKLLERKWAKPIPELFREEPSVTDTPAISIEDYLVDPADHINANNQFAIDFYSKVSQENIENNIFFSPTSISTAFSILYEGAKENTAKEIQQVFGFPENDLERKHGYFSLHKTINEKSSKDVKLQIANALWLAENFEPLQEYTDTATTYYDSTVSVVDFVSDDGVNQINDWVKEKTEEKIEKLLEPGSTGSTTRMAITNAIYFKGLWEHPFDPEDTYEGDFTVNSEKTVKVPMMTYPHKMQINAAFTEQMKVLEMPYKNNTMSMLILLPNEIDDLKTIEDSLTLENLEEWKEMLSGNNRGIVIHIPKFSLETDYNLIESLPDMGMPSAFNSVHADLSGITGYKGLYISQAIHKAFVDVNEVGTEAAAATAIVLDESGGQLFKADHPFLFIIQDNETGQILFIGRVMDPTV